jgi:hypothetical protein
MDEQNNEKPTPTTSARVYQTEKGTWLATWHNKESTPPMESVRWRCHPDCRSADDESIGKGHLPLWERIDTVAELGLLSEVRCMHCGRRLNEAESACVEVY